MVRKIEDASIIETIRKMVAAGNSEEDIVKQLRDLGVDLEKAKRLVLLGQADTFALLKSEISKIVAEELEKQKPHIQKIIDEQTKTVSEKTRAEITKAIITDLKQYEKDITGQSHTFQDQIQETVQRMSNLSERVKDKLNELGSAVKQVQLDLDEMKLKGVGSKNRFITLLLVILGLGFCVADLYLFFAVFSMELTVDGMIIMLITALIGISMLFVSTIV